MLHPPHSAILGVPSGPQDTTRTAVCVCVCVWVDTTHAILMYNTNKRTSVNHPY